MASRAAAAGARVVVVAVSLRQPCHAAPVATFCASAFALACSAADAALLAVSSPDWMKGREGKGRAEPSRAEKSREEKRREENRREGKGTEDNGRERKGTE